jgi:FlaA1/EpsC-like NDP-sugar epimerase
LILRFRFNNFYVFSSHFALSPDAFPRRDINLIPTLIVGTNREAEQTINELKQRPDLGYRVIGIVATERFHHRNTETQTKKMRRKTPKSNNRKHFGFAAFAGAAIGDSGSHYYRQRLVARSFV